MNALRLWGLLAGWLLLGSLAVAGTLDGRPWPGTPRAVDAAKPARAVDSTPLRTEGLDGQPAWYWPELAGNEAGYRVLLPARGNGRLAGLLIGLAGLASDSTGQRALRVRVDSRAGAALLDTSQVLLSSFGLDTLWLGSRPSLEGVDSVYVEIIRATPWRSPWPTADDDCRAGNGSWLRVAAEGNSYRPLDRDLNIRLLVDEGEADLVAPDLWAPAELGVSPGRNVLPLRVRLRDNGGLDTLLALGAGLPAAGLGGRRLGGCLEDAAWEEWLLELPSAALPAVGVDAMVELEARDRAGNRGRVELHLTGEETLHHGDASGRADQSWQPGWPPPSGLLLAVPVDLAAAAEAHGVSAVAVDGARLSLRALVGDTPANDSLRIWLMPSGSDGFPVTDSMANEALAPRTAFGWSEDCPGALEVEFALADPGASQGSQVWLVLDYSHPNQQLRPSAPLLEWFAPGEDTLSTHPGAWSWEPLSDSWQPVRAGRPLLEARVVSLSCDRTLPFVADFDNSYPELDCWSTPTDNDGSAGWQTSDQGTTTSTCFAPEDARFDPEGLRQGRYVYINSDQQGQSAVQDDWLITPWLSSGSGAVVSFSSCLSSLTSEYGSVMTRRRVDGVVQPWDTLFMHSQLFADAEDSLAAGCGGLHPRWARFDSLVVAAGTAVELQVGFHYTGHYSNGWALDSIRVDPAPAPAAGPFDGPAVKPAELGRIHPNPFNPETVIPFRVLRDGPLTLEVYNLAGQRVAVLAQEPFRRAGEYRAVFRPGTLASGLYLARLEAAGAVDVRRLVYLK